MGLEIERPFEEAFGIVMPQLGFQEIRNGERQTKDSKLTTSGITMVIGIVGEMKGNVVFALSIENAKKIVSTMMMGMPVESMGDMEKSALSELSNMLAANTATCFSKNGITIDISTPTLLEGDSMTIKMSSEKVHAVTLYADNIAMEVNIAIEKR